MNLLKFPIHYQKRNWWFKGKVRFFYWSQVPCFFFDWWELLNHLPFLVIISRGCVRGCLNFSVKPISRKSWNRFHKKIILILNSQFNFNFYYMIDKISIIKKFQILPNVFFVECNFSTQEAGVVVGIPYLFFLFSDFSYTTVLSIWKKKLLLLKLSLS